MLNPWRTITGKKYITSKVQRVIQRVIKVQLSWGDDSKLGMLDDYFLLQIVGGWLYTEILRKKLKNWKIGIGIAPLTIRSGKVYDCSKISQKFCFSKMKNYPLL